ncbi:hypothetical protein NL676_002084 [Syzygium grande]|nr:hypothetical protein NL676_002084 [Syzygium grande]
MELGLDGTVREVEAGGEVELLQVIERRGEIGHLAREQVALKPESQEAAQASELPRDHTPDVVVGNVETDEAPERGYLRPDLAGKVVPGKVEELEVGAVGEGRDGTVQPVIVEIEQAELVQGRERVDGSAEVEGRGREGAVMRPLEGAEEEHRTPRQAAEQASEPVQLESRWPWGSARRRKRVRAPVSLGGSLDDNGIELLPHEWKSKARGHRSRLEALVVKICGEEVVESKGLRRRLRAKMMMDCDRGGRHIVKCCGEGQLE